MKVIEAALATSAVAPLGFPAERLAEIALVGRSNVGKSSLINALVGRKVARTSAAPGKTRLANFYRVAPADQRAFYLVDLPGYGHAGGGADTARVFERITAGYFRDRESGTGDQSARARGAIAGAILVVDSRHPGLANDLAAHAWLLALEVPVVVAATKIDKLSRSERVRAGRELERVFGGPVTVVSAATGEGLGHLWKVLHTWIVSQPAHRRPLRDR